MNTKLTRDQEFIDAFEVEELEERLEFRDWSGEAGCETDFQGSTKCSGKIRVD